MHHCLGEELLLGGVVGVADQVGFVGGDVFPADETRRRSSGAMGGSVEAKISGDIWPWAATNAATVSGTDSVLCNWRSSRSRISVNVRPSGPLIAASAAPQRPFAGRPVLDDSYKERS